MWFLGSFGVPSAIELFDSVFDVDEQRHEAERVEWTARCEHRRVGRHRELALRITGQVRVREGVQNDTLDVGSGQVFLRVSTMVSVPLAYAAC